MIHRRCEGQTRYVSNRYRGSGHSGIMFSPGALAESGPVQVCWGGEEERPCEELSGIALGYQMTSSGARPDLIVPIMHCLSRELATERRPCESPICNC